jgi:hypothetical protein
MTQDKEVVGVNRISTTLSIPKPVAEDNQHR